MRIRHVTSTLVTSCPRTTRWGVALASLGLASACSSPSTPIAFNLVDYFADATVVGTVEVESLPRTEWRFDGAGTVPAPEPPQPNEDDGEDAARRSG